MVGYTNSFIDDAFIEKAKLWQLITRGITNELSAEHRIFQENLRPKKRETEIYIKAKTILMKEGLAKKKNVVAGKIDSARLNKSS